MKGCGMEGGAGVEMFDGWKCSPQMLSSSFHGFLGLAFLCRISNVCTPPSSAGMWKRFMASSIVATEKASCLAMCVRSREIEK